MHKDLMIHRPFSQSDLLKGFFEGVNPGWGNWHTPNVAKMNRFHSRDFTTNHRANIRTIISYFEDSEWIVDGGTSEKFFSSKYFYKFRALPRSD